jgi:hypothetical protein
MFMASIQVKNVPEDLHRAARARADEEGTTLSNYVLGLLQRDLQFPSRARWLEQVLSREPVEADVRGALRAERASRDESLDRAGRR